LRVITPLAAVPKELTKFRAIHDLRALNDHVPPSFGYLSYASLDDLFFRLRFAPPGCFLWKVDLTNAFRHIRLSPQAQTLAGFELDGCFYADLCLPFGSRVAPVIFNYLAEGLHWILLRCGITFLLHYLDDFFGYHLSFEGCKRVMDTFFFIASCLGVSINPDKCSGPSTRITILGIEIDTRTMQARLSDERRSRMLDELLLLQQRGTCSRKGTRAHHRAVGIRLQSHSPRVTLPPKPLGRPRPTPRHTRRHPPQAPLARRSRHRLVDSPPARMERRPPLATSPTPAGDCLDGR
jgi:hypothetical protein